MTLNNRHKALIESAVKDFKTGTGERGQFRAFLGKGDGLGHITNEIAPSYREVWYHTGNQPGTQSAGQQISSAPLSWLAALVIPYVNDPQYENMPIVVGYAPGSSQLEVLRPDGLGAANMLRNPGIERRLSWFTQPPGTCQGRLTAVSGQAYGDAATYTTLRFTPYGGALIGSFNGYTWRVKSFTEQTLSLSGLSANQNFDIFWVDSTGSLAALGWSSNTARATALVQQDGIWCENGTLTNRYLGTIRTTGTIGTGTDTPTQRYIWNFYNRLPRPVRVFDATASWVYTGTMRQADGAAANKIEVVSGFVSDEAMIHLVAHHLFTCSGTGTCFTGVGVDSTTAISGSQIGGTNIVTAGNFNDINGFFDDNVGLGYHAFNWLEQGAAGVTFYGGAAGLSSGLSGHYWA